MNGGAGGHSPRRVYIEVIAGFDDNDPTSLRDSLKPIVDCIDRGVTGLRIGFDDSYGLEGVDPRLDEAMQKALITLEELGAEVERIAIPQWTEECQQAWLTICVFEAWVAHRDSYPEVLRGCYSDGMLKEFLEQGAGITADQYTEAMRIRELFTRRFNDALAGFGAVACSSGAVPFAFSPSLLYGGLLELKPLLKKIEQQFVEPTNFTGMPTLSLRCGFSAEGLPLTIQFISHRLNAPALLRIGHLYEKVSGWYQRHPTL
jgi:Asp-tRNA(Asn)/Glu-tRNA(Gln) amidotransferase A subunit family amidase